MPTNHTQDLYLNQLGVQSYGTQGSALNVNIWVRWLCHTSLGEVHRIYPAGIGAGLTSGIWEMRDCNGIKCKAELLGSALEICLLCNTGEKVLRCMFNEKKYICINIFLCIWKHNMYFPICLVPDKPEKQNFLMINLFLKQIMYHKCTGSEQWGLKCFI